mgnify:CR=1
MYKRLSDSEHTAIHAAYMACEPVAAICNKFNIAWGTVYEIVKSFGTKPRRITIRKLSWKERQIIVASYLSGKNTHELAKEYKVSVPSIAYILKRNAVKCRPSAFDKIYQHNEGAFDCLSDESAYWIGFLMADGHVRRGHPPSLELHLALRDIGHLRKFRRFLKAGHKIGQSRRACRFQIRSYRLIEQLNLWGIGFDGMRRPHPKLLINRHFWRGFIDGDGCLGIYNIGGRKNAPCLHLVGQKHILDAFMAFGRRHIKTAAIPSRVKSCIRPTFAINLTFRLARTLIREFYQPGDITLERKRKIAEKILEMAKNPS